MIDAPPPPAVLAAFGARGTPQRLSGGRGLTWRAGDVVLRPAGELDEARWKAEVHAGLAESTRFTIPRPLRDPDGAWVRDGWEALEWFPGEADPSRVDDVVRVGEAFHRAVAGLAQPDFIRAATDLWSVADRMAWSEEALPTNDLLAAVQAEYRPLAASPQDVHGDLLGNVLFSGSRPPAVIDWAPYWRPTGYAAAIVVADAACWHGYPLGSLGDNHGFREWRQLLLRALAFRMTTQHLHDRWDEAFRARHAPVVAAVIALDQ